MTIDENELLSVVYRSVENTGGAYGIGNNKVVLFLIMNLIEIVLIVKFILLRKNEIAIDILLALYAICFLLFVIQIEYDGCIENEFGGIQHKHNKKPER